MIYQAAVNHANHRGKIDWPDPVPRRFVAELISTSELYCFEEGAVVAAAKLSRQPDERIWNDGPVAALYLAKLGTGERVRSQDYFQRSMLPAIIDFAGPGVALRLDCLADNVRLQNCYKCLGFTGQGDVTFYSEKQQRPLTVTRFEKAV